MEDCILLTTQQQLLVPSLTKNLPTLFIRYKCNKVCIVKYQCKSNNLKKYKGQGVVGVSFYHNIFNIPIAT